MTMLRHGYSTALAILVLSDRAIFRDCLLCFLHRQGFRRVAGAASVTGYARKLGGRKRPDLVLLDLRQEKKDPHRLFEQARRRWPEATVVAIGTPLQLAAHARDADGCLELPDVRAHDVVAIATAVQRPHQGRVEFPASAAVERQRRRWGVVTAREREVLDMLACGADNLKIAAGLAISERAVKAHISSLFAKLGVENRTELALLACHAGLHCPVALCGGSLSYN